MAYKYSEVNPIRTTPVNVWLVKFLPDGPNILTIWALETKIEQVVEQYRTLYPDKQFTVSKVTVGEFQVNLEKSRFYSSDGRAVNQDFEVGV